jgi:hypothetical protein
MFVNPRDSFLRPREDEAVVLRHDSSGALGVEMMNHAYFLFRRTANIFRLEEAFRILISRGDSSTSYK